MVFRRHTFFFSSIGSVRNLVCVCVLADWIGTWNSPWNESSVVLVHSLIFKNHRVNCNVMRLTAKETLVFSGLIRRITREDTNILNELCVCVLTLNINCVTVYGTHIMSQVMVVMRQRYIYVYNCPHLRIGLNCHRIVSQNYQTQMTPCVCVCVFDYFWVMTIEPFHRFHWTFSLSPWTC